MSAADDEDPGTADSSSPPFRKWLLLSLILIAMLAFAAAHVSGRAGIVCRFPLLFGLVTGATTSWLAGQGGAANSRRRTVIAATLAAAGFVGITLESHRLYVDQLEESINSGGGLNVLPPQMTDDIERNRAQVIAVRSRFSSYLRYRISANQIFGDTAASEPWPAVIWAIEILVAALVAAGTFHVIARPPPTTA